MKLHDFALSSLGPGVEEEETGRRRGEGEGVSFEGLSSQTPHNNVDDQETIDTTPNQHNALPQRNSSPPPSSSSPPPSSSSSSSLEKTEDSPLTEDALHAGDLVRVSSLSPSALQDDSPRDTFLPLRQGGGEQEVGEGRGGGEEGERESWGVYVEDRDEGRNAGDSQRDSGGERDLQETDRRDNREREANEEEEEDEDYYLRKISFLGRDVCIILQNRNGPCPLIALANVLLLTGRLSLQEGRALLSRHSAARGDGRGAGDSRSFFASSSSPSFSSSSRLADDNDEGLQAKIKESRLLEELGALALEMLETKLHSEKEKATSLSSSSSPSHAEDVYGFHLQEVLELLPQLKRGLDVNCHFSSPVAFEYTAGISLFDLFHVHLVHGWLPDFPSSHFSLRRRKAKRRRRKETPEQKTSTQSPPPQGVHTPQDGVSLSPPPPPPHRPAGEPSAPSTSLEASHQQGTLVDKKEKKDRREEEKNNKMRGEEEELEVGKKKERRGGEEEDKKENARACSSYSHGKENGGSMEALSPHGEDEEKRESEEKETSRETQRDQEEEEMDRDKRVLHTEGKTTDGVNAEEKEEEEEEEEEDQRQFSLMACRCEACLLRKFTYNKLVERCTEYREVLDALHHRQLREIQEQQEEQEEEEERVKIINSTLDKKKKEEEERGTQTGEKENSLKPSKNKEKQEEGRIVQDKGSSSSSSCSAVLDRLNPKEMENLLIEGEMLSSFLASTSSQLTERGLQCLSASCSCFEDLMSGVHTPDIRSSVSAEKKKKTELNGHPTQDSRETEIEEEEVSLCPPSCPCMCHDVVDISGVYTPEKRGESNVSSRHLHERKHTTSSEESPLRSTSKNRINKEEKNTSHDKDTKEEHSLSSSSSSSSVYVLITCSDVMRHSRGHVCCCISCCKRRPFLQEYKPCILFRNNHFSTIVRCENKLYSLATDSSFRFSGCDFAVWERLEDIRGDNTYCDCSFLDEQEREKEEEEEKIMGKEGRIPRSTDHRPNLSAPALPLSSLVRRSEVPATPSYQTYREDYRGGYSRGDDMVNVHAERRRRRIERSDVNSLQEGEEDRWRSTLEMRGRRMKREEIEKDHDGHVSSSSSSFAGYCEDEGRRSRYADGQQYGGEEGRIDLLRGDHSSRYAEEDEEEEEYRRRKKDRGEGEDGYTGDRRNDEYRDYLLAKQLQEEADTQAFLSSSQCHRDHPHFFSPSLRPGYERRRRKEEEVLYMHGATSPASLRRRERDSSSHLYSCNDARSRRGRASHGSSRGAISSSSSYLHPSSPSRFSREEEEERRRRYRDDRQGWREEGEEEVSDQQGVRGRGGLLHTLLKTKRSTGRRKKRGCTLM